MTAKEMEDVLVDLGQQYVKTRDPEIQEAYRALHADWLAAKAGMESTATASGA